MLIPPLLAQDVGSGGVGVFEKFCGAYSVGAKMAKVFADFAPRHDQSGGMKIGNSNGPDRTRAGCTFFIAIVDAYFTAASDP